MSIYNRYSRKDLTKASELLECKIHPEAVQNVRLFQSLHADPTRNLSCPAISPFTGKPVLPVEHFGIDSDPWMHAILYRDKGREFIIICQGLTNSSHLGSIVLPKEKLILCNYDSWYYNGAYLSRIERNLPRILNYFRWRKAHKATSVPRPGKPRQIIYAIGNQRVGDYIMQMLLLDELQRHPEKGKSFDIQSIYVNRASEFMGVEELFPEISNRVHKLNSFSHIEYHARYFPAMLFADVRVLSSKRALQNVKKRISDWVNLPATQNKFAHVAQEFRSCTFTIWVNLELEKRIWAEQEVALPEIINKLCKQILKKGERVGIIFNGMTGYTGKDVSSALQKIIIKEQQIADKVIAGIRYPLHIHKAIGCPLAEKLVLGTLCDFVVAPLGSASMVPSLLLDKPGIVYAYDSEERATFAGPSTVILKPEYISERKDLKAAIKFDMANQSYSFNWKNLFKEIESNFRFNRKKNGKIEILNVNS